MRAWLLILALGSAWATPPSDEVIRACDAAVEAEDAVALRTCVETWVYAEPTDPLTDWYGFHLAVLEGNSTAANAARTRALERGLAADKVSRLKRMELPHNPMLGVQRVFLGLVLLVGLGFMVWARWRSIRNADALESAEHVRDG